MKTLLKKFDMYGYQPKFMVEEKELYTSVSGGIFSIFVLIFGIFYFLYTFIPFYERKNYTVTSNWKKTDSESPFFIKNETKLEFEFIIENWYLYKEDTGDYIGNYFEVELIIISDFYRKRYSFSEHAYKVGKDLVLNLNFTNSSNMIVKEIDKLKYIAVRVWNITPYDNPEMEKFLDNRGNYIYLTMKNLIKYIDFDDYENTFKNQDFYFEVDFKQKNILSNIIILSKNEFISDNGLIWSSNQTSYFLSYDRTEVYKLSDDPDLIFEFSISYERTYYYKRIYEKFPDILAKLNAFLTLINKVFAFIFTYIYSFTLKINIIRNTTKNFDNFDPLHFIQIFKKISNDHEKIEFNKKKNNNTSEIDTQYRNNFLLNKRNLSCIQFNKIKIPSKNKIIIITDNFKIKGSLNFFCKSKLCLKTKKKESMNENLKNNYDKYINISYYIVKLKEINLIKEILISQGDKQAFDFISRNIVDHSRKENYNNNYLNKKDLNNNLLLDIYCKLQGCSNLSKEESKLLEMFNQEIDFLMNFK
jgi:hypothetical protein